MMAHETERDRAGPPRESARVRAVSAKRSEASSPTPPDRESARMQFATAARRVVEWLPLRISLGPGFHTHSVREAKWAGCENDVNKHNAQRPALLIRWAVRGSQSLSVTHGGEVEKGGIRGATCGIPLPVCAGVTRARGHGEASQVRVVKH